MNPSQPESLRENIHATTITTLTRRPHPSHTHQRPVHSTTTTETVERIIIVLGVETDRISASAQGDGGFGTSTLTGRPPSSTTWSTTVSVAPLMLSFPSSSSPTSSSSSSPKSSSSAPSRSSSVSASSSSSDLKAGSGAKATLQPPGTAVNNDSSPTGTGTVLPANITTSSPLIATTASRPVPVGAIIGVVIAGALVMTLAVLLLVLWAKRRSARAARNAEGGYGDHGMRQTAPVTAFPPDLQPNRAGGSRVQNWMSRNSHLAGTPPAPAHPSLEANPSLVANPQYPFAAPVALASPQRPTRQRGDTLSSVGLF